MAEAIDLLDKEFQRTAPIEVSKALDRMAQNETIGLIKGLNKESYLDNEEAIRQQKVLDNINENRNIPLERPEFDIENNQNQVYLKEMLQNQEMSSIKGLDKYQYRQLLDNLSFADFNYSLFNRGDGNFDFYFPQNKSRECTNAFIKSCYELEGPEGKFQKEIIDLEESMKAKIKDKVSKDEKEWALVDSKSDLILVVNKNNFDIYKDGKPLDQDLNEKGERLPFRTNRESPDFEKNLKKAINKFIQPIICDKNEVNLLMKQREIKDFIKTKEKDKITARLLKIKEIEMNKSLAERERERLIQQNISNKIAITQEIPKVGIQDIYNETESLDSYQELSEENREVFNNEIDDKINSMISQLQDIKMETTYVRQENTFPSILKSVEERAKSQGDIEQNAIEQSKERFEGYRK